MKPRSHASRFAGYIITWTQDLKTDFSGRCTTATPSPRARVRVECLNEGASREKREWVKSSPASLVFNDLAIHDLTIIFGA
jgi:hypothetical protein